MWQYFETFIKKFIKKTNKNNKSHEGKKTYTRIPGFEKGSFVRSFWKNGYSSEIKSHVL